jgi:hypothetical protein
MTIDLSNILEILLFVSFVNGVRAYERNKQDILRKFRGLVRLRSESAFRDTSGSNEVDTDLFPIHVPKPIAVILFLLFLIVVGCPSWERFFKTLKND